MLPILVAGSASVLMSKGWLAVHACKDTLALHLTVDRNACSAPTALLSWPASSKNVLILALEYAAQMLSAKLLIIEPFAHVQQILQGIHSLVATNKQVEIYPA